jgi:hypothetical protein
MSDPTNIFNSGSSTTQSQTTPTNQGGQGNDPLVNLLASIKTPDGRQKYNNLEDALKALQHSQEFIPSLQTQLSEREQQLQAARAEAARIEQLENTLKTLTEQRNTQSPPASGVSESRIAELVQAQLTQVQQQQAQAANQRTVAEKLAATFGDKAEEIYNNKAAENGMTVEAFNRLAATSPQAVLKLVGATSEAAPSATPTASSINTTGFQPKPDSFVKRNDKSLSFGTTTQDLQMESLNARKMVDELHSQGLSVDDLTKPSVFFKVFQG